jgi:Tol biopolymer transport system component
MGLAIALVLAGSLAVWFALSPGRKAPVPSRIIPFTTFPGKEIDPAFSPDGNQLAYAWEGENGDNFDIYVQLIGTGSPLRLTRDPGADLYPAWSPDGRSIAFVRQSR